MTDIPARQVFLKKTNKEEQIPFGIYEHYKGKRYEVLGIARHSETLEPMVVYKALYESEFGKNSLWVRPLSMFIEMVVVKNKKVPRFRKVN